MLKPVTLLALDETSLPLAQAVEVRVTRHAGVEDLVQARAADDLARTIHTVHAQRQRPDSPLRVRDDVSTRELVLVMLAAAGPARASLIETTRLIREIYETRRFASYVTIELLCLLPEVTGATRPEDYASAYALLKALSAEADKPFNEVWLLDATNASRVKLGALDVSLDAYAEAIAGALTYEPEMSGAIPGNRPRGMHPTFSSFGYASLVFPRDVALRRVESRFSRELIVTRLLSGEVRPHAQLAAKQFVADERFAMPLSRIGVDAGQSLFRRFQPKTQVTDRTRSAEEVIAAVRGELQTFRDSMHLRSLQTLAKQADETIREHAVLLAGAVDETLDRGGYDAAASLLDALLDPLPELRPNAELAPRNLVIELRTATAALDTRLRFTPDSSESYGARKRVRDLETLIQDQQVVADTVAPAGAATELEAMEREKAAVLARVPEILFAEEKENNAARNTARETEAARLTAETADKEQELRELFVQLPRAEQGLREALETRRAWLWRQVLIAVAGVAVMYAIPFGFGVLSANFGRITWMVGWAVVLFGIVTAFRYLTQIAPLVRDARERLARVRAQIEATDQAKNAAHDAELQFEYDVALRRAAIRVLREAHDAAKDTLNAVRARRRELDELAESFAPASIASSGLTLPVVDDAEVDAWYERTVDDRKPFVRELPIARSVSRHLPIDEMRRRIAAYASTAFAGFRKLTLATAASTLAVEPKLTQRMKRFADTCAPLIEIRDDDLQAQQSMQRDCTLWLDTNDAPWIAQLHRRFAEAHLRSTPDALCVHAVTRVLHYPAYVLAQIEYYRAQYEASSDPERGEVTDLVPAELIVGARVRDAYEQLLLGRALGIVTTCGEELFVSEASLGDSNLAAAQALAAPGRARDLLDDALVPRLEVAADVTRELRALRESMPLTLLDRNVLDGLMRRYEGQ
jgi:hypothetical protein